MSHDLRPLVADDVPAVLAIRAVAFASPSSTEAATRLREVVERGGFLGVEIGGQLAGVLNVHALGQYFGGRSVPMGGVASVAVAPEHRGKGIASALLRAALVGMRDRGQVISTLHPATVGIYRAAGWELAGEWPVHQVASRSLAAVPSGEPDRLRRGSPADLPSLRACYERVAPTHSGWVDRPERFWYSEYAAPPDQWHLLVVEGDGGSIDGFALYELEPRADGGYGVTVHELVAADVTAARTLWRGFGSFAAQAEVVTALGASALLLTYLLPEQDRREVQASASMTRVVDVVGAVAARGFPLAVVADVHLAVRDTLAPWNDGPRVLRVRDGRGVLEPGGRGALTLTESGLGALYTGFASAHVLAAAGLLEGPADDRSTLDAVFAGPRPSMLEHF